MSSNNEDMEVVTEFFKLSQEILENAVWVISKMEYGLQGERANKMLKIARIKQLNRDMKNTRYSIENLKKDLIDLETELM